MRIWHDTATDLSTFNTCLSFRIRPDTEVPQDHLRFGSHQNPGSVTVHVIESIMQIISKPIKINSEPTFVRNFWKNIKLEEMKTETKMDSKGLKNDN